MSWLDRFPLTWLIALAVWMAVAPVLPEPHLLEKMRMLWLGTLQRPLDIFDLCLHLAPAVLLCWRLLRQFAVKRG